MHKKQAFSPLLAAYFFKFLMNSGAKSRAFVQRIAWDWSLESLNKSRFGKLPNDRPMIILDDIFKINDIRH